MMGGEYRNEEYVAFEERYLARTQVDSGSVSSPEMLLGWKMSKGGTFGTFSKKELPDLIFENMGQGKLGMFRKKYLHGY